MRSLHRGKDEHACGIHRGLCFEDVDSNSALGILLLCRLIFRDWCLTVIYENNGNKRKKLLRHVFCGGGGGVGVVVKPSALPLVLDNQSASSVLPEAANVFGSGCSSVWPEATNVTNV